MKGEIVSVTTSDTLRLHGLFCPSSQRQRVSAEKGSVDAAVLVHGLAGNFYSSRLLNHFVQPLLDLGISVVIVNTRGHDMINTSTWAGRARSVGAALENVDHCRFDLNAWTDFLVKRGYANVMLFGHSLGAIKSLYATAHAPHPNVGCVVGLSATRLSYQQLMGQPEGAQFREIIDHCESLIAAGRENEPIRVAFPFPTWMTPKCYLDKYGPAERFNWLQFVDQITLPTLLVFGEKELQQNAALIGLETELKQLIAGWNSLTIETVPDADHFYTSKFSEVDELVTRWLTG